MGVAGWAARRLLHGYARITWRLYIRKWRISREELSPAFACLSRFKAASEAVAAIEIAESHW